MQTEQALRMTSTLRKRSNLEMLMKLIRPNSLQLSRWLVVASSLVNSSENLELYSTTSRIWMKSRTDMPSFPLMPKVPNIRIVKSRLSESLLRSTQEKEVPTKPTLAVQSMAVQRRIAHMPRTQLLLNRLKQRDRHSLGRRQSGLHSWTMSCHRQTWTHRSQHQRWYIV